MLTVLFLFDADHKVSGDDLFTLGKNPGFLWVCQIERNSKHLKAINFQNIHFKTWKLSNQSANAMDKSF